MAFSDWNTYLDSLAPKTLEQRVFIEWCRDKEFTSLTLATDIYRSMTGLKIKPQDLVPF